MLKRTAEMSDNPTEELIRNDTKGQLLRNDDQLNKQDKQITGITKTAIQTTAVTNEILGNLKEQRGKINMAIQDTKDSKANVQRAKVIIERMNCREFCYRASLYILIILLGISAIALLVFKFTSK